MSLAPLLNAPLAIQAHAFAAMAAFALGLVQFAAPKGTLPHRTRRLHLARADADGGDLVVLDSRNPHVG